jgi:hemerythrin-like domain-containing protein
MNAIQMLQKEHTTINLSLFLLDKIMERLIDDPTISTIDDLEELVEFYQIFADRCHHQKEERYVFPPLIAAGIKKNDGPIGVFLSEHEKARRYIQQLSAIIPGLRETDATAFKQMEVLVKSFTALISTHIQKEDTVLFPMAATHLSVQQQDDIHHAFEKLETETIGEGRHEQFHQMLSRLTNIYR